MNTNLVIIPTRGRPDNAERAMKQLQEFSTISDLMLAIDDDDEANYPRLEGIAYEVNPRLRMNGTLNLVANKYADKYETITFLGDDHMVRTEGWDEKLYAPIKERGYGLAYGNDLFQKENLPTAVMQSTNIIRTLGYFAPPKLIHLYMDNYWKTLGQILDALFYKDDVIVEHMHYLVGKSTVDEGYIEVNSGEIYNKDRETFIEYVNTEFAAEIAKLEEALGL